MDLEKYIYDYLHDVVSNMTFDFMQNKYDTDESEGKVEELAETRTTENINIRNIVVDANKSDIVNALIKIYKPVVYTEEMFEKHVAIKCSKIIGSIIAALLLLFMILKWPLSSIIAVMLASMIFMLIDLSVDCELSDSILCFFKEDGTFRIMKRKLETFYELCDIMEDVQKKSFKELLESVDILRPSHYCDDNCYSCYGCNNIVSCISF